jgi:hypothetical protein
MEFQDQLHDSQFLKRENPSSYYEYAAVSDNSDETTTHIFHDCDNSC